MISKPGLDREKQLQEDIIRRRSHWCFDAVVAQLGEGEAPGEPVRVGDQVVIPIVRVEENVGSGPRAPSEPGLAMREEDRLSEAGTGSLRLTFGEARPSPPRRAARDA